MDKEEIFDGCVKEAIEIGRKHMKVSTDDAKPTKEEWTLALVLFQQKING